MIEKGEDYPAFVETAKQTFGLVVEIVTQCQQAGILRQGAPDLTAVSVWALIHGFVTLLLENQISHTVLDRYTVREMFVYTLGQITLVANSMRSTSRWPIEKHTIVSSIAGSRRRNRFIVPNCLVKTFS